MLGHSTGGRAAIELATSGGLAVEALGLLAPAGGANEVSGFAPRPVLVIRGTNDLGHLGDRGQSPNVYAAAGPKKHMITISGANHFGFYDSTCILADPVPTISRTDQQRVAKAYVTAFFRRYLHGSAEVEDYLTGARVVEELEGFGVTVDAQV